MTLPAPLQSGRLPQLGALRFTGADALSFLQGQISNDTRRLAQGQTLFAAYSSPQGRVLALMHLLPHSSGILAIVPRELVAPTLERLRKFVLRAKVKIEDAGANFEVAGQHGTQPLHAAGIGVPDSNAGYLESDGLGVAAVNGDPSRYWVIGSRSSWPRGLWTARPPPRIGSNRTGALPTFAPGCRRYTHRPEKPSSRRC